jgi:hypothetical protein
VDWDHLPAARRRPRVDGLLAEYVRGEVLAFSTTEPARFAAAGIDQRARAMAAELARLPPVPVGEVDGIEAVLRPTPDSIARSPLRSAWWWAGITRRRAGFVEDRIDPRYRAIHFDDDGLVVASSAADLDRLGDVGRRWLALAGVRTDDAVVSVLPARADLAFWQLTLGCRRAGVPALHLGPAATATDVTPYAPTVLAGRVAELRRLAIEAEPAGQLGSVRLVLVTGWLEDVERLDLAARLPSASIRWAWAPPGVRALWAECRAGALHTWPDTEVVEALDARDRATAEVGSLVWSPVGWRGTVVLRLRTGAWGRLVDVACPCGASSPRIESVRPPAAGAIDATAHLEQLLAAVLDREPCVAAWQADVGVGSGNGTGAPEVAVLRLAPTRGAKAALEADLPRLGRATGARRLVVERPSVLEQRLAAGGGRRVVP